MIFDFSITIICVYIVYRHYHAMTPNVYVVLYILLSHYLNTSVPAYKSVACIYTFM